MKKLILIANDLESTGKTTTTHVLSEYLERKGIKNQIVATDVHAGPSCQGQPLLDLNDGVTASDFISMLDKWGTVIIDLHSDGGAAVLGEIFQEEEIGCVLSEIEAELTIVIPANEEAEGYERMVEIAEVFNDDADYIVVHTPMTAEIDGSYEHSEAAKALDYLGSVEVEMPEFDSEYMKTLEELGLTLGSALANRKALPRHLATEVHAWELAFAEEFIGADEFLLPGSGVATSSPYRKVKKQGVALAS